MSLISGAIDIHDDIIDESKIKGNRLTVFGKYGKNIALLVGDALIFKGFTMLNNARRYGIPIKKIEVINKIIKKTFFELGDAEALELKLRGRIDVSPEEYLQVVRKKAADVEATTRIGAILGDGSEDEINSLGEYGRILGMLVILRDDIIDMLDPEELIHRIKKEHLSLGILYSLKNPIFRSKILTALKSANSLDDSKNFSILIDKSDGFNKMHNYMFEIAEKAKDKLEKIKNNKKELALLINGMLLPDWKSYLTPPDSNR